MGIFNSRGRIPGRSLAWVLLCVFVIMAETRPVAAEEKVSLQLRWKHQFQFAGYYMAKKKGFYRERGLEVDIREIAPGVNPVEAVCSGAADFGIGDSGILVDRIEGKPIVVMACVYQHSPLAFLVKKSSKIESVKDLAGKRVMLLPGNQSFSLIALLRQEGVLDRIRRENSSFRVSDLIEDRVDAYNAYLSNEPYYLEIQNIPRNVIRPQDYDIDFYGDTLFTTARLHRLRPELALDFRDASMDGWRYALDHVEETIDCILADYGSTKERSQLRFEANVVREMIMPNLVDLGHINPRRWEHIAQHLQKIGVIAVPQVPDDLFCLHLYHTQWMALLPWLIGSALILLMIISALIYLIRINRRLRKALTQVQELSGMLPICASCKKIRNDAGYWQQIEGYIQQHSQAQFSHSICPDCAEKLYGKKVSANNKNPDSSEPASPESS